MCLRTKLSWIPWGSQGLRNLHVFRKNQFPTKTILQLPLVTFTYMLLITRKIGKAYKVRNFLDFIDVRPSSRHFFRLGAWREAKTRACVLRFSVLRTRLLVSQNFFVVVMHSLAGLICRGRDSFPNCDFLFLQPLLHHTVKQVPAMFISYPTLQWPLWRILDTLHCTRLLQRMKPRRVREWIGPLQRALGQWQVYGKLPEMMGNYVKNYLESIYWAQRLIWKF